ncbi:hypothetical protein FJT64_027901 [Amphibalanus amphitrite]|uniref:Uncharacterized protein n=1 Tax=Amphibalanus amphitrite TaxID=1232801 RepID=A0A6A4WBN7_AMPAM|nr:hypothetical protein FJT64_027901 [Amphibalanus amphitrite]
MPLQRPRMPAAVLQSFSHLELADPPSDRQLTVDILVGLDCYWDLTKQGEIRLEGGPVAQETALGWIISGKTPIFRTEEPLWFLETAWCSQTQMGLPESTVWDLQSLMGARQM